MSDRKRLGLPQRVLPEDLARARVHQQQPLAGTGDGNVGEAALLVDVVRPRVVLHAAVRKHVLFHAGDDDALELEALGGVDRHERDRPSLGLDLVGVAAKRHPLEEAVERRLLTRCRRLLFVVAYGAHELLKVLEPARRLDVVLFPSGRRCTRSCRGRGAARRSGTWARVAFFIATSRSRKALSFFSAAPAMSAVTRLRRFASAS